MLRYKIDVMQELKKAGYTTYRIRQEKLIGQSMLAKIKDSEMPSWAIFDKICELLECQPGDIIEHISDEN